MFSFWKKKGVEKEAGKNELRAILSGEAVSLGEVPDEMFASKVLGDGVAFKAEDAVIIAPCDCEVYSMNADMKHAIGLKTDAGMELLIHVGVDTVELAGKGFEQLAKEGTKVKSGTPLLKFDREVIRNSGLCDIVIFIVSNAADAQGMSFNYGEVVKGESIIATWE